MRKYVLLSAVLVLMSSNARAEDNIIGGDCSKTENDNCSWSLNTTTGALTISGTGKMKNYKNESINDEQEYGYYNGEKTYYSSAPWGIYQVNSITIENGIENVGNHAFQGTNISTIDFPPSVTSLGAYSFLYSKIQSVEIPNTVTSFSGGEFESCYNLVNITLSENMTSMPEYMFSAASSLTDIEIPDNVEKMGSAVFRYTGITSLVIPEKVTSIAEDVFIGGGNRSNLQNLYCTQQQLAQCQAALTKAKKDFAPTIYEKSGNDYLVYDEKGNIVGKYTSAMNLSKGMATETYKYDSAGHLVGIFDGNGQRTWGKKIYTVEEAMEVTKNGDKFHVFLTYK